MQTRREFMTQAASLAALGLCASDGNGNPYWRSGRSPSSVELPDDPTPEEVASLRRRWGFWMDAPEGYVFKKEYRLVRRYTYTHYNAELYLQRNGPEEWQWQRVIKVFPKKIDRPLAAVGIPYYHIEGMLGHELEDESAVLERYVEVSQAAQLARRGYMAIACDLSQQNYVKYDVPPSRDHWTRFHDMAYRLAEDWPMWNSHAHRVFVARLMLDLLEDDPRVDRSRIGMTGHSLGGQTCFHAGCLDPRVKAIMASDFALNFDQSCWDVLHYFAGKLRAVRADGLENHTMLTISGGKPFCLLAGFYDDARSYTEMTMAKGYKSIPGNLRMVHHAAAHRAPQWALEAGYEFLDRCLGVTPEVKLCV